MGIADWFTSTVANVTGKTPQQHADDAKKALNLPPSVTTDAGVQKALGTAPEAPGTTITGGRRRKTRKGGRRGRKTHRRR